MLKRLWPKLAAFIGPKRRPADSEDVHYFDVGRQTSAAPVYVDMNDRFRVQMTDTDAVELGLALLENVSMFDLMPYKVRLQKLTEAAMQQQAQKGGN